jgi:hypothetical protein
MPRRFSNLKGTILIVTYGRSGSTLLQTLLQTIPGAHIAGENFNILEALYRASKRAQMSLDNWGQTEQPPEHPWFNADRIRPQRFEKALARAFINDVLAPPKDARWIGFKEIRTGSVGDEFNAFLNFHRRIFPKPFFVFNSRRAEDVAQSAWWKEKPRDEILNMVNSMDERFAAYAAKHPKTCHHVFYEDTVADPASLRSLFNKLEEPMDMAALRRALERRLTH